MTGALIAALIVPAGGVLAGTTAGVAADVAGELPLPAFDAAAVGNAPATVSAGTAVGGTQGGFSVSDEGVAGYSVPLRVVPGRGGFQPALALSYSSDGDNAQIGVGFALDGLSHISRCAKTLSQDQVVEGPRLNDSDPFCLDGKRLKLVSGTYGGDGAEYRTVPDSLVRVKSFRPANSAIGGPFTFTVESPDGIVRTYGTDTVTPSVTSVVVGGKRVNVAWPLGRAQDRSANVIRYRYGIRQGGDGSEIERWLSSIEYGTAGQLDRLVQFGYETRPDPVFGFQYGARLEGLQRLKSVTMSIDSGGWKQARSYTLKYQHLGSSKISKLEQVIECGAGGTDCLRPTTFSWSAGTAGFDSGVVQSSTTQSLVPSAEDSQLVSADLNGDGRTDLAWPEKDGWRYLKAESISNGPGRYLRHVTAGITGNTTKVTGYPFDFDLDGRIDLLPREPQNIDWRPWLSRDNLATPLRARTNYFGGLTNNTDGLGAHGGLFGDFDGDGYQDVLEYNQAPAGGFFWSWRRRSALVGVLGTDPQNPEKLAFSPPISLLGAIPTGLTPKDVIVLDVDGDGRDELVYRSVERAGVLDVARPSVPHPVSAAFPSETLKLDMKLMDLNGDGLLDVVTNGQPAFGKGTKLYHQLNTGRGFAAPVALGVELPVNGLAISEIVDAENDGRQDLLVPRTAPNSPNYDGMELVRPGFGADGNLVFTKSPTPISFAQ